MGNGIRVGTASWTDPEFIKAGWYPPDVKDDAAGRLRYYADRFPMVEVNATFYALPTLETTAAWAERTPDDFRFHVKAHQVISGHPSEPGRLPPPLRELPARLDKRGRIRRPSRELRDAVIDALRGGHRPARRQARRHPGAAAALRRLGAEPARGAGPDPGPAEARPRGGRVPPPLLGRAAASARRRPSCWRAHDAAWVCVDAPRIEAASAMPPIVEVTSPGARLSAPARTERRGVDEGQTVAERFDHAYTDDEMEEWLDPVLDMAERAQEVAVVFNNNARDYALRNATRFAELVSAAKRRVSRPPE